MKPQDHFRDISLYDNVVVRAEDSRKVLAGIGIGGEIVRTPGHSNDSISLLLDNGWAFTGDLPHPSLVTDENASSVATSWCELRSRGATTVYPGHGPARAMPPPGDERVYGAIPDGGRGPAPCA